MNYKKYSLEHLEEWVHDALNCEDITPQEIYQTICKCVDENIEYHKTLLTKNIDLLSLLKGQTSVVHDVTNDDWMDFWHNEDSSQYTDEVLDAMCERAATEELKQKCIEENREYNLREAEYYNKRAQLDAEYNAIKADGYSTSE